MIAEGSIGFCKAYGCLVASLIGDAMGEPAEGKDYRTVERELGWIEDFGSGGTDDTIMRNLLSEALIETDGWASLDDWAAVWLRRWDRLFGDKRNKFFPSVLHTAFKLRDHSIPRMAALGNMPSSSSAMAIAPVGIVNACNPRQAAVQAYGLAALIHVHDVGFCQDGAAAVAAAVAEAFSPGCTAGSVVQAAQEAIVATSGKEMRDLIATFVSIASESPDYPTFRRTLYEDKSALLRRIICDSRETVPVALSVFTLAGGDVRQSILYGANFGRDADTIATIAGAIAGAYCGYERIPEEWRLKIESYSAADQREQAAGLIGAAHAKLSCQLAAAAEFRSIMGEKGADTL